MESLKTGRTNNARMNSGKCKLSVEVVNTLQKMMGVSFREKDVKNSNSFKKIKSVSIEESKNDCREINIITVV